SSTPTHPHSHTPIRLVDRLCAAHFLARSARETDDNLVFVREQLLRGDADRAAVLDLYLQVWSGKRVPVDPTNPLIDPLLLAGIVSARRCSAFGVGSSERTSSVRIPNTEYRIPLLRVRNRIYA